MFQTFVIHDDAALPTVGERRPEWTASEDQLLTRRSPPEA